MPGVTGVTEASPDRVAEGVDGEESGRSGDSAASEVAIIPIAKRPCFEVFDRPMLVKVGETGSGKLFGPGVGWFYVESADKDTLIGEQHWICSPLYVIAQACDERSERSGAAFGRVLRYRNTLNRWGTWTMPMEMLSGDGSELRGILLDRGVKIDPTRKGVVTC